MCGLLFLDPFKIHEAFFMFGMLELCFFEICDVFEIFSIV